MLDFGGQYSQLIARRIRECGVFAELLPHDPDIERIRLRNAARARALRRPASVYEQGAPSLRTELLELGIPVLGICYGMQAMVHGARRPGRGRRARRVRPHRARPRRRGRPAARRAARDAAVLDEPPRLRLRAAARVHARWPRAPARRSPPARTPERGLYGIQFHPEVVHTPHGQAILERFLREVAGCREQWSAASVIDEQVDRDPRAGRRRRRHLRALRRRRLGDRRARSSTAAIGDQLTCVLVDHGLLRKGEAEQVVETFREGLGIKLIHVDARRALPRPPRRRRRPGARSARSSARSSSASSRRRR